MSITSSSRFLSSHFSSLFVAINTRFYLHRFSGFLFYFVPVRIKCLCESETTMTAVRNAPIWFLLFKGFIHISQDSIHSFSYYSLNIFFRNWEWRRWEVQKHFWKVKSQKQVSNQTMTNSLLYSPKRKGNLLSSINYKS